MKNSVSDRHLYVNDTDGDDDVVNEEGALEEGHKEDDDSDESESSCGSPRRSIPNSYTTSWPQSYRQSIDIYTSVTPPTIGFLGTPTLSRLSGSFLTTSFRGRQPPEVLSSLVKPLIPSPLAPERRSSQALLPRIPSKHKVIKSYQELPPPSSNCSYGQAVLNGVNVLCGVGILSTPYAVKEGGWIGLVVLFVFAVLAAYTGLLLRRCLDSEPGLETYPDIGQAAFGTFGRVFISVVLYVELFGCCVEYIILEGDNLSSLFPHVHLDVAGFRLSPQLVFAALTTLIVLPTTWLRDLSVLSYISAGGVVASILVVLCLFWIGAVDKIGPISGGTLIDFKGFPIALGLYGYCYSGHGVFPNIYSSLKNPNQYPAVVFTAFGVCSVMFAGVAVVGYLMFGESTESQFTLNLPHGLMASNIAVWTTVVNPISKYALTLTPLALSLEELIPSNRLKTFAYPIMIRTALVISTLVVGLSVPFFGLVMSLIGSLLTMLVTLILPCACYLSILKGRVSPIEALSLSFSLSLSLALTVCLYLFFSLSRALTVCLCLFFSLSRALSLYFPFCIFFFPLSLALSLFPFLSLFFSVSLSFALTFCLSPFLSFFLSLSPFLSLFSLYLSLSLFFLCLPLPVSLSLSLPFSLSGSLLALSVSLSVSR